MAFALKTVLTSAILATALPAFAQSKAPEFWKNEWPITEFDKSSVSFVEILSGGPPKDGIPAIDGPEFATLTKSTPLPPLEPVVTLEMDGQIPRAYPIRYLMWHEIVNDRVGDIPVTVTYCPLCNSAIVFDGRSPVGDLTFGVSGKLRNSDMIMYDRQSESWWQQFTGEAIVGKYLGTELTTLPAWMESYAEFSTRNPNGLLMQEPKSRRAYGSNPYAGYDRSARPFLYNGEMPPHGIEPLARIIRVGKSAWLLDRLRQNPEITEDGVRITWKTGQASALDTRKISEGRDIGTIRVYGAKSGAPIPHEVTFAFAFHAFQPDGIWHLAP